MQSFIYGSNAPQFKLPLRWKIQPNWAPQFVGLGHNELSNHGGWVEGLAFADQH